MEFVRHRVFSFAQESTRYCNYSRDKFGNELTFILPPWVRHDDFGGVRPAEEDDVNMAEYLFIQHMYRVEDDYLSLINRGWTAQQARDVLPNSIKTELVMTGFISDWEHFFELRDAQSAHPQARELAKPLHEEFINKGLI